MEEIEYLEEYEDLIMPNAMNCIETGSSGRTSVDSLDALYKELIAESEKLAKAQTQQTPQQSNTTQHQATVADGLQAKPFPATKCSTNPAPTAYTNVTSASELQPTLYRNPANVSSSMPYLNSTSNKSFSTGSSLHKPEKLKSVATVKPTLQRNNPTKNSARKNVPPQRNAKPYSSTTGSFSTRPRSSFGTKSATKTSKRTSKTTGSRIDPLKTDTFLDFDDDKNGLIDDFDFDSDLDNSINMGLSDMDSDSVDFSDDYSNFEFDSDLSSDGSLVKKSNVFNKSRSQNSSSQKHGQKPKNKPGSSFKRDATKTYKSKSSQKTINAKITSVAKLPNLSFEKSPNMASSKKSFQFDKKETSTPHPATKNRRQSSNETASKPPPHFSDDRGKSSGATTNPKTSTATSATKKSIPPRNESEWNRGVLSKIVSPLKVPDKASALRPDTSAHNSTMEKNKKNDSLSNAKVIESFSYDSSNKVVASSKQHQQAMPSRPDLLSPEKNGLPKIGLSYLRSIKPPASKVFPMKDSPHKIGTSTPQATNESKKNSETPPEAVKKSPEIVETKQKPNVAKANTERSAPLSNKDETKVTFVEEPAAPAKKTLPRRKSLAAREALEESRTRRKSRDVHYTEESNSNVKPREKSRNVKSRESYSEQPVTICSSDGQQTEIVQNDSKEDVSESQKSKYTVEKKVCDEKTHLEKVIPEQTTKDDAVKKKPTTLLQSFKPKECSVRLSKMEVALLLLKDLTDSTTSSPSSSHRSSENVLKQKSSPSSKVHEFNSKEHQMQRKVIAPECDRDSGKSQSVDMGKSISTTIGDPPPCNSEGTTTKSQATLPAKETSISDSNVPTEKPQRRKTISSTNAIPSGSSTESTKSHQNKTNKSESVLKLNDVSSKSFEKEAQLQKGVEETANKSQLRLRRKSVHSTKLEPLNPAPETLIENNNDATNKLQRASKRRRLSTPNIDACKPASDRFLESADTTEPANSLDAEDKTRSKQTRKTPAAKADHQNLPGGASSEKANDKTNSSESMLRNRRKSSLNNEPFEEASRTLSEPTDAIDQAQNAKKRKTISSNGSECGQDTDNKPMRKTISAKIDHQGPHTIKILETDGTIERTSSSPNVDVSDKASKTVPVSAQNIPTKALKPKSMQPTGTLSENSQDVETESQAEVDHLALAAGTVSESAQDVTNNSEKRKSTTSSKINHPDNVVLPEIAHDSNKSQNTLKRKATSVNVETSPQTKVNNKAAVNKSPKDSLPAETQEMGKRPKISYDNVSPVRQKNKDASSSTDEEINTKADNSRMRKKRRFNLLTATPKALRNRKSVSASGETNEASEQISAKQSKVQEKTDSDFNERIVGHNRENDTPPKGTPSKRLPAKIQDVEHVQNISADESSSNEVDEATKQRSSNKSPVKSNRSTSRVPSPSPSPTGRKLRKRPGRPIMGRNLRKYALKNTSVDTIEPRKTLKSPPPRVSTKSNCTPQKEKAPVEKTVTLPGASTACSTTATKSPPAPVSIADPDMDFESVQPKKEIFSDTVIFQCHPPSMNRSGFLSPAKTSAKKPTLPTPPPVKPTTDKPSVSIAQPPTGPVSIRTFKLTPTVVQTQIVSNQKNKPDAFVFELPSYIVMKTKIITREELHNNKAFVPQLVQQTLEKLVEERQAPPEVKTERPEFRDVCLQINNLLGYNANYLKFASASERQSRMQQVLTDSTLTVEEAQCAFKFLQAYLSLRATDAGARAKNQKFIPIYDSQKKIIGYRKRTANSRRPSQQMQNNQLRTSVRQVANRNPGFVQHISQKAPAPVQQPTVTSGDILNVRTVPGIVSNTDSQFTTKTEPPTLDGEDDGNETIIPDATVAPAADQCVKDETTETTVKA